jgi:uncharacterized integral membrane protein
MCFTHVGTESKLFCVTHSSACFVFFIQDSPFSIVAQVGDFGALSLIATKRCEAFCFLGYKD